MNALLLWSAAIAAVPTPAEKPIDLCDNKPVLMVVSGPTHDRDRMIAYGKAIADSGLYKKLGGYYLNSPRPLAVFEGSPPPSTSLLIVRFPCLANARAFWYSKVYQEKIIALRLNPSAGDYTVSVYPEIKLREDMVGKVGDNKYLGPFDRSEVEPLIQP